jgi:hypothetical protein
VLPRWLSLAALTFGLAPVCAHADPMPARHTQGTLHGFLALHGQDGKVIAEGDLIQVVHGDRVTMHLVFHFADGSLDDETTVFTQHRVFQLVSDHHIQRGPYFTHPMETNIVMRTGQVTVTTTGKDGKPDVKTEHMKLPPDLANGLTGLLVQNMLPTASATASMVVATPKPRLVKLVFTPGGEEPFSIAGFPRKATHFTMKIDLGGIAGVVAPLIGKQPPDFNIWVVEDEAPVLVKETGYLYEDGPTMTIYFASPIWPQSPDGKIVTAK